MSAIETGGPAFPSEFRAHIPKKTYEEGELIPHYGISIRDYFAAQALIGLIINPATITKDSPLSARAYEIADYMMARRSEHNENP